MREVLGRGFARGVVRLGLPALVLLAAAPVRGETEAHLFQQDQCVACHLFPQREGTFLRPDAMRRDVNTLCFACHEAERTGVGHRVGMVASMRVPEDFPLDPEGRMTCATCHDPHAVEGPHPDLLRRAPGREFCELCHASGFSPGGEGLVHVAFPPEGAVLAPGETVVAGTLASRSVREVVLRAGPAVVRAPVVDGAFAARVPLLAGQAGIAVEAGGESRLLRVSVRRGGAAVPWRPHLTADPGQCSSCHAGRGSTGFFSPDPPAEVCYRCHGRLDRMPQTHRPAGLGECTACHDPHGGGPGLPARVAGDVCLRCHDRDAAAGHIIAANADLAVPATACGDCHDPHQSTRPALTTSAAASLAVALELEAPEPAASVAEDRVELPGFRISDDPGRPQLPERIVAVAVPPGADAGSAKLRIVSAEVVEVPGRYRIAPAPPAATWVDGRALREWGRGRTVRGGKDTAVYGASARWPRAAVSLERSTEAGALGIVRVAYRPLQFNPADGSLTLTRHAVAEITFRRRATDRGGGGVRRQRPTSARGRARELGVANAGRAASWQASAVGAALTGGVAAAGGAAPQIAAAGSPADYVVVTTRAIVGASAELPSFLAQKAARGLATRVVTEDEYGEAAGQARAHAVRTWLQDNREALGIRYVLLVGNPDPDNGDLPMLRAWPRHNATSNPQYQEAPTDLYFSDLSGNWDLDGDGYYGEFGDDGGDGGVDFAPEVFVGRIPVYGAVADLDAVLRKIVAYESATGDLAWRRSALLPMSFSDASTDGAWLAERMKADYLGPRGFTPWTLYQQGSAGGGDSTFDSDEELRGGAVLSRWTANRPGVVAWWGHGSTSRTVVGYSPTWDGDILAAPLAGLDDAAPAFVYQTSCLNGYPELSGNLGFALLRRGAIASVSASRVSWYYVGQTSFAGSASNAGLGYGYVARLSAGEPAGRALGLAKGDPALSTNSSTTWMNLMDFNLYGDPAVGLFRGPLLELSTPELVFTAVEGEAEPVAAGISLSTADAALAFEALPEAAWLSGSPLSGQTPATLALSASPAGLPVGDHAGQVLIVSAEAGNSPLALPVTLRIVRPGRITGRVASADGAPVTGATVALQGPRSGYALTDAGGGYGFDRIPPGTYDVAVSGTGFVFQPTEAGVVLAEGDTVVRDFLGGTLEVRGRTVRAANGKGVRGARVQLLTPSGTLVRRARTRADGSFRLAGIAPGEYRLRARHKSWRFPAATLTLVDLPLEGQDLRGRRRR